MCVRGYTYLLTHFYRLLTQFPVEERMLLIPGSNEVACAFFEPIERLATFSYNYKSFVNTTLAPHMPVPSKIIERTGMYDTMKKHVCVTTALIPCAHICMQRGIPKTYVLICMQRSSRTFLSTHTGIRLNIACCLMW